MVVQNSQWVKHMAKRDHLWQIAEMTKRHRWAALATMDGDGVPAASMVAYALDTEQGCLYLHLSGLAAHTKELLKQPVAGMVISECDAGDGDPQQLARLSLCIRCAELARESDDYLAAKQCYLQRLPNAEQLFGFADFKLFKARVEGARFVGGFGQAHSYSGDEMVKLLQR